MIRGWLAGIALWAGLLVAGAASAHETLPASLLLDETSAGVFDVTWRVPATQGTAPAVQPRWPADCAALAPSQVSEPAGARLARWAVRCTDGLRGGARLAFDGLGQTMLDVVVRVGYLDGRRVSLIVHPRDAVVMLPVPAARLAVAGYFGLGMEHIAGGLDHLLFITALFLLVRRAWPLAKTITAFTLAHSLTLALAALGVVHVPGAPVEAAIALSILFLARELLRPGACQGFAARSPWVVAFAFGLLHGFGFAGALAEVGLPEGDIPLALLMFNLGVEAGQLVFVGALAATAAALSAAAAPLRQRAGRRARWIAATPAYAIGGLAAFWWLERLPPVLGLASA